SKCLRGWSGLLTISSIGRTRSGVTAAATAGSACSSSRADRPRPSPRFSTIIRPLSRLGALALAHHQFPGQPQIGAAAATFQIIDQGGLAKGWRLGDPHIARYDRVIDLVLEVGAHIARHLFRQAVALVIHGQDYALNFEGGIEAAAHQIDGAGELG